MARKFEINDSINLPEVFQDLIETLPDPLRVTDSAYLSDGNFSDTGYVSSQASPALGLFLHFKYKGTQLLVHSSHLDDMYHFDNWMIKKNYYFSPSYENVKQSQKYDHSETQIASSAVERGTDAQNIGVPAGENITVSNTLTKGVSWGDADETWVSSDHGSFLNSSENYEDCSELLSLTEVKDYYRTTRGVSTHTSGVKDFINKYPRFFDRDLVMFDYVNLFVTPANLFNSGKFAKSELNSMIAWIEKNQGKVISSHNMTRELSWSTKSQFLFNTLLGEFQIDFVRACAFHCMTLLVGDQEEIRSKVPKEYHRYVLMDDEASEVFQALLVRFRVTSKAMSQNATLVINRDYAAYLYKRGL